MKIVKHSKICLVVILMSKVRVDLRLNEHANAYLIELTKTTAKSKTEVIETLLLEAQKRKSSLAEDIAKIVYVQLSDKLKGMHIAVNENNKLLKTNERMMNYHFLINRMVTPLENLNEWANYKHPALVHAKGEVQKEIKALQITKANQKKKQKG